MKWRVKLFAIFQLGTGLYLAWRVANIDNRISFEFWWGAAASVAAIAMGTFILLNLIRSNTSTPFVTAYPWIPGVGFGMKYTAPAVGRPSAVALWGDVTAPPADLNDPPAIVGLYGFRIDVPMGHDSFKPASCYHNPGHKPPVWGCSCGYYAWNVEVMTVMAIAEAEVSPGALQIYIVSPVGRTVLHERGFRCERYRVEAVVKTCEDALAWVDTHGS